MDRSSDPSRSGREFEAVIHVGSMARRVNVPQATTWGQMAP